MLDIMSNTFIFFFLSFFINHVASLGKTDTITWGGDNSRTGYQTNHNMDPQIVGSAQFGQIFKAALPGVYNGVAEQIFSQVLVYTTPSDNTQYLYVATTQNNIYKLNAATGAVILKRNLHIPFLSADLDGCVDINPHVGVTATGVIDSDTDTWYLTSKTYLNQTGGTGAQGKLNGRYYFHAINVNDLSEQSGFPIPLEGTVATNNPVRVFGGGIHHQRPALLHSGQYIYAGFASHCVHDNFTGWIMGWDKTTGAMVEKFATEGLGVDSQTKGGGVWMSGGGLASDDAGSMFFATGNGYASQLSTIPVNGRNPPTSLEEAAVHMTINDDGSLTIVDFFMPWEKTQLDGADRDLGTSPLEILPSDVFTCGDVKRIGVVTGKSGKTYWLNLDDLGGYQNGANKLDNVIQVYQNENSVYAGAGVYPLEGGYIYINVIQYPTHVFKFSCVSGVPSFTKVADSPENNAYLGVGHGTTTSLDGTVGTGLFWVSDVNGYNLRVYNAVPSNGVLTLINHFNIPGVTKFTRPVFGNGRVYIGTTQGFLYGFGAPVNPPLNCSGPYVFGTANISQTTAAQTVKCTANIATTVSNITLTGNADFIISSLPAVPLTLAAGASFSFQAFFKPTTTGVLSSDVVISTQNGVTGYSVTTPVSLQGTGQSVAALLSVSPVTVAFQGVITGEQVGGVNQTVLFINQGNSPLTITGIQYSNISETGPFNAQNTSASGFPQVGPFTFYNLPTTIAGNSVISVIINFDSPVSGNFAAYLVVNSNGGSKTFDVVGTSGNAPIMLLEFQTTDGLGWVKYTPGTNFTFGNVTENQTRSLKLRITNNATVDSASLSLTISKPPFGVGGIIGANNQIDLAEGTTLAGGQNATATLYCSVPKEQWDTDSYGGLAHWTFNSNDATFPKTDIPFVCEAVSEQAPPLLPNGYGQYRYVGCFKENNPGRQLATQLYGNDNNTNAMCIAACAAGKYVFCGTQYNRECWAGPTIPNLQVDETNCDYPCKGDINQICGGNGVGSTQGGAYISLFADSLQWNGNTTTPASSTTTGTPLPTGGPYVNPGVLGYTSIGCYAEPATGRALPNQVSVTTQTVATCLSVCGASNYIYAGLEYGGECWCGNAIAAAALPTVMSDCKMTCNDNTTEYCGGSVRLNMYQFGVNSTSSSSVSSTVSSTTTSNSLSSSSTLSSSSSATSSPSSGRSSASSSSSSSVSSSGSVTSSGASSSTASSSSSSRTGTSSSVSSSLSGSGSSSSSTTSSSVTSTATVVGIVPTIGAYVFQGCWTEATGQRALSSTTFANDSMTLEACAAFCRGFSMFGVEYGRECYCGNTLNAGSVQATNAADCMKKDFYCPGNPLEYCGGSNRLELYSVGASSSTASSTAPSSASSTSALISSTSATTTFVIASSSTSSSSSSLSTSSSSHASSSTSTTSASVSSTSSSSLPVNVVSSTTSTSSTSKSATVSSSSSSTKTSSTSVSSTSTSSSSSTRPSSSSSSTKTSSTSISSTSVSSTSTSSSSSTRPSSSSSSSTSVSAASSAPATYTGPPVTSNGNVNFTYYGCVSEPSNGRLLPTQVENNGTAMTIEKCLTDCYMYAYAGVEYGRECWCGNTLSLAGSGGGTTGAIVSNNDCSFSCPGNSSEFCGAGVRMSLFVFNSTKAAANAKHA